MNKFKSKLKIWILWIIQQLLYVAVLVTIGFVITAIITKFEGVEFSENWLYMILTPFVCSVLLFIIHKYLE